MGGVTPRLFPGIHLMRSHAAPGAQTSVTLQSYPPQARRPRHPPHTTPRLASTSFPSVAAGPRQPPRSLRSLLSPPALLGFRLPPRRSARLRRF
jgi:hypothetical protein